ncbi:MAG TPA: prolipoprotein diacylglyceryl transferase, partial [Alphaproteobacteria bacterium]|nr:prolipoprotein diacylglyceryl transferase [Alphaproteobacteria bacterium]
VFAIWQGGMSFHGGLIGVSAAVIWFCWRRKIPIAQVADRVACVGPVGLFFGRLANFINQELWGRPTDVPWAMIFPKDPLHLPRHPSQLYEAGLEGIMLFLIINLLFHFTRAREKPGLLTGVFFAGYGLFRMFGEFFREPDANIGFLFDGITMGQLLSFPMVVIGLVIIYMTLRKPDAKAAQ